MSSGATAPAGAPSADYYGVAPSSAPSADYGYGMPPSGAPSGDYGMPPSGAPSGAPSPAGLERSGSSCYGLSERAAAMERWGHFAGIANIWSHMGKHG